jgi:hypothetical protein
MTGGDVDDAQAAMAEADVTVEEEPFIVRSAVANYIAHGFEL